MGGLFLSIYTPYSHEIIFALRLALAAGDELSVDREIEVIDAQLATQAPDRSKIKAALQSVKRIVEGSVKAGLQTAVATGIIHLAGVVLAAL
jgi:hypothetical protein